MLSHLPSTQQQHLSPSTHPSPPSISKPQRQRHPLLQLLLGPQLVRVTALLFAAICRSWWKTGVACNRRNPPGTISNHSPTRTWRIKAKWRAMYGERFGTSIHFRQIILLHTKPSAQIPRHTIDKKACCSITGCRGYNLLAIVLGR